VVTYLDNLEFEFYLKPSAIEELSHYLIAFSGKAQAWDDDTGDDIIVGKITGYRLDIAAARADALDLDEFIDSVSAEISDFKHAVCPSLRYTLNGGEAAGGIENAECEALVYISKMLVPSKHRGNRIGTFLMQRLSEVIDMGNGLVGLKAFPLADETINDNATRTHTEIARVKHFYEKLGFQHAGGEFMKKDARDCPGPRRRLTPQKSHAPL
jgi:GNAT superfamily N-acetyltransferase